MEAHIEHGGHVCDAGGVKAQRLVESTRSLPSPNGARAVSSEVGAGGQRWVWAWGRRKCKQGCVVCDPTVGGAQWARERSAYCEHEAHVFNVGRVPAQWLVESMQLSDLTSQKGACGAGGVCGPGEVGGRGVVEMGGAKCRWHACSVGTGALST